MATVDIHPMPGWCRKISLKYRPVHPPFLHDVGPGGLTPQEIKLARELFKLLDDESKDWYGRRGIFEGL